MSIEQVLARRGLLQGLRPSGDQLVGPCPLHGGDNPRAFVVDRRKALWHCWTTCRGGGDVVDLVRRLDHVSYALAARYLAACASEPPLPLAPLPPPRPARDRHFRPFLADLRLDHDAPPLAAKGIRPETARDFEVGAWHGGGMLQGCVAVRLRDPEGSPLGYAGRRLDPDRARSLGKWVLPPRLPKTEILYGFHRARSRLDRGLAVVECPWGVLRLAQIGVPAVALLGTDVSKAQQELLADVPRLLVLMDGDPAGRRAARSLWERRPAATCVIHLPDGRDPDDLGDADLDRLVQPHLLS